MQRAVTCIKCRTSISHLFPNYLISHLWTTFANNVGYSTSATYATIQEWSSVCLSSCTSDQHHSNHQIGIHRPPPCIWFEVWPEVTPKKLPSITINLPCSYGSQLYKLLGIIYLCMNHYTCCFLDFQNIWSHDGQKNNGKPIHIGNINTIEISHLSELETWFTTLNIYQCS